MTKEYLYEGYWKQNQKEGQGRLIQTNSTTFEGVFKNDTLENGVARYPTGDKYTGEFVDYMRQGTGLMKYKDGRTNEGQWI